MSASQDSAETKPELQVLGGDAPDTTTTEADATTPAGSDAAAETAAPPRLSSAPPAAADPSARGRGSRLVWLLAAALVLCLVWALYQGQRAATLEDDVARLERSLAHSQAELSRVGVELEAYRSHLGLVRETVDVLSARVLALRELAHASPLALTGEGSEPALPAADEADDAASAEGDL